MFGESAWLMHCLALRNTSKKLQRKFELQTSTAVALNPSRAVEPDADAQSFVQIEAPPWAESYEIQGDADSAFPLISKLTYCLSPSKTCKAINSG